MKPILDWDWKTDSLSFCLKLIHWTSLVLMKKWNLLTLLFLFGLLFHTPDLANENFHLQRSDFPINVLYKYYTICSLDCQPKDILQGKKIDPFVLSFYSWTFWWSLNVYTLFIYNLNLSNSFIKSMMNYIIYTFHPGAWIKHHLVQHASVGT